MVYSKYSLIKSKSVLVAGLLHGILKFCLEKLTRKNNKIVGTAFVSRSWCPCDLGNVNTSIITWSFVLLAFRLIFKPLNPWNAEIFWCINHGDQRVCSISNHHKCLSQLFLLHLNTLLWVYGHYKCVNYSSAGIVLILQNLKSADVRFWRIKTVPALKGLISYFITH